MIPIIMDGSTKETRQLEVERLAKEKNLTIEHIYAEKSSILISQIRSVLERLSITSKLGRLVWIEEANLLTLPASNALLKALEEPGQNTLFVLTLKNKDKLLETIRSRCNNIRINSVIGKESQSHNGLNLIKECLGQSDGDRLLAADSLGRKRDVLSAWTLECLEDIENKIRSTSSPKSLKILTQIALLLHNCDQDLSKNISVTLTIQNFFLHLPHTR